MIKIPRAIPFFPVIKINQIYFSGRPGFGGIINNHYLMSLCTEKVFGFKRLPWYTKLLDLSPFDNESLLASFHKSNIYKIKRAEKEGVLFGIEKSVDSFITFYNDFAASKGLPQYHNRLNELSSESLLITKAVFGDETLVMHAYLFDKDIGRAILLRSASLFRHENDTKKRNLTGRANRFLHYKDMIYLFEKGYTIYDFGGYGQREGPLAGIDEFKDSFNGEVIQHSIYYPVWQYYFIAIWKYLRKKRAIKKIPN